MKSAKIFKNGHSQAVRLPKDCRFDDDHVLVKKSGDVVMLIPEKESWVSLVKSVDRFSDDFMSDRLQPPVQRRQDFK